MTSSSYETSFRAIFLISCSLIFLGMLEVGIYYKGHYSTLNPHLRAVFEEQVRAHSCKITPYWKDG